MELFVLPTSVVRIFDPVTEEVTCVHAHGVTPTARYRHVMEFFERKREIVMFGGKVLLLCCLFLIYNQKSLVTYIHILLHR